MKRSTITRVAGPFGTLKKRSDGFFSLTLKTGATKDAVAKKLRLRGVDFVLPGTAEVVEMDSRQSLGDHSAYIKARARLQNKRHDEERDENGFEKEEGGDFYDSLKWYIDMRSGKSGKIDKRMYQDAVAHREHMPKADPGDPKVGGIFTSIGPKSVSTPYNQYMSGGPVSGRKNGIAYAPSNPAIIYVASAGGGVWKSTNSGASFTALTDKWPFLNTTSVAVHPTNPNIVYVGTGDYYGNFSTNAFGMMKSTDGGATWTNVGNSDMRSGCISHIIIEPTNPNIILCSVGKSGNNDSHINRSTDGGNTWVNASTYQGNWDDIDRATNGTYYAVGTYPGTSGGMLKSTDKGATWTLGTSPAASVEEKSMDIACSKVSATTVYMLLPSEQKVYKSTNSGTSWTEITGNFPNGPADNPNYNWSQGSYDYHISCGKDGSTDLVFVGLITVAMSRGGSTSWVDIGRAFASTTPNNIHSDQHSFAMNPATPNQVLFGCDGGLFRFTQTAGTTGGAWAVLNSSFTDFLVYEMAISKSSDSYLQGGCQDNFSASARGSVATWTGLPAGDGCWAGYQKSGQNFVSNQFGGIFVYPSLTSTTYVYAKPQDQAFKTGFFAPFVYAEATPKIYAGADTLWKYSGTGQTWTNLNHDITPYVPQEGTPVNVVTELETAKNDPTVVYSGSSYGEVFLIKSNGTVYKQIDDAHIDRSVGAIDTAWANQYDVLVGLMGDRNGNPRLWRCTNTQATTPIWTNAAGSGVTGLPDVPVNGIERDPFNASQWYVATDVGCFMTTNSGSTWQNMTSLGLPNVLSSDIYVNPSKTALFIATFGRGIWKAPLVATATKYSITGHIGPSSTTHLAGASVKLYKWKTSTLTYNSSPHTAIPDYDANGVYIPIDVPVNAKVSNTSVYVSITHQIPNDLEIWLVNPGGAATKLWSSDVPVEPNLAKTLQTGFFNGTMSKGRWNLFVRDIGPLVEGTVDTFNLSLQYEGYGLISTVTSGSTGVYTFSNLEPGLYYESPSMTGKTFTPRTRTTTIGPSRTGMSFTSAP